MRFLAVSRYRCRDTAARSMGATLLCLAMAAAATSPARAQTTGYFTDEVWGNQYANHTHFQYHNGKTYVTLSATPLDDPYIWAYDHNNNAWLDPVKVGVNELPTADEHGNPSMIVDNDGYIHVWYGGHGTATSSNVYARSANPEDISSWIYPAFETDETYPSAFVSSNGSVSVAYRNGNHSMPGSDAWVIQTSTDNGLTWGNQRTLIQQALGSTRSDYYAKFSEVPGTNRIAVGVGDEYLDGGNPSRHSTEDFYYFEYDLVADRFYNAAGDEFDFADGLSDADLNADVRTPNNSNGFYMADMKALGNNEERAVPVPVVTPDGNKYIVAYKGDPALANNGTRGDADTRVWAWNDTTETWDFNDIGFNTTNWGEQVGNDIEIWASGTDPGSRERLLSSDGGQTWTDGGVFTPVDHQDGDWYSVLFNPGRDSAHPDARAVLLKKGPNDPGKAYLWGDSGIIPLTTTFDGVYSESESEFGRVQSDGTQSGLPWVGNSGNGGANEGAAVYFYELPTDIDEITSANLTIPVLSNNNANFNVDLYALGYVLADSPMAANQELPVWFHDDSTIDSRTDDDLSTIIDNDAAVAITRIQENFLISSDGVGFHETDELGDAALVAFLNLLADEIASDPKLTEGKVPYLVIRLNADIDLTGNGTRRFELGNTFRASQGTGDPTLLEFEYSRTAIPEPASLVLMGVGGLFLSVRYRRPA